jgi:type I restriction enzyme, S subunit
MSAAVMLSDVAELVMGQSPPSTSYNDAGDGLPFYQGKTDFGATYPTPRIYCREPKKLAEPGDILMSVRAPVGATNLCKSRSCIGRGIAAIRANGINRDFLYFYLKKIEPYIDSLGSGAIFKAINKSQLAELPVNHAGIPLPEQKKIAHILSTVQRAIEAQERIIQTTTELKKALMHKLFTEGLRNEPQKQTELGLVPESWEVVDLGDVINLFAGYAFKSAEGVSESNTQLLRMGNLYQNTLDLKRSPIYYPDSFADAHKRFVLKEGDLVMSLTGTSGKEDYGFTVRIPKMDKTLLLNQRVTRIDVTDHRLQKDFAHHFLLSRKFLDYLYPTAKGMKQANLSTHVMKKLKVVLPGKAEQLEIATCFKSLDQKVVIAGRKIAALQDLFRTLLHELMTAKTRVHDLELPTGGQTT